MGSQKAEEGVVIVAVSKHTSSIQAVKWALANKIVSSGTSLKLVHVQPILRSIPTPSGELVPEQKVNPEIVATYRRDRQSKTKQDLQVQLTLCDASQVQAELVIVEGDDIANSLMDEARRLRAKKFIIGKSSKPFLLRKLKGLCVPDIIEDKAPKFCSVFVITNGKLVSLKAGRGPSHSAIISGTSAPCAPFLQSDFTDVSGSTFSGSEISCDSFSVPQTCNGDVSLVRHEDFHVKDSKHGALLDLVKLKVDYEQRILKAEQAAGIAMRNATMLDAYAKEEARKREKAMVEAHIARQELAIQGKALEAARLAREEEAQRRKYAEDRANQLESSRQEVAVHQQAKRVYREYDFEELKTATNGFSEENVIGRGGYGYVYKGKLHHTTVAVKVLDKHSVQGLKEFQQEVEFLSRMHHPHIVLLLGACPEQGCLVYEYLANGSLEDRLRCVGDTAPLPWQTRFRIVAEVATALLFLHSLKPNPYVHRDLKPGNILLDQNYMSKVGDVGLAALAPCVISYDITQYRETIPVGTPTYIDPAYQTTGVFTPRSDVFAFGIVVLQILTGEGPFGLPAMVEVALNQNTFQKMLDSTGGEWPVHEAAGLARIALQCSQLDPRHRTDVNVILPQLEKLATFANEYAGQTGWSIQSHPEAALGIPSNFLCPLSKEIMAHPHIAADGFTYELAAIKKWLQDHRFSPVTSRKLQHKNLIPNHNLRTQILEWKQQHPSTYACRI